MYIVINTDRAYKYGKVEDMNRLMGKGLDVKVLPGRNLKKKKDRCMNSLMEIESIIWLI